MRLTDTLITGFVQLQEHLGLLLDVAVPVLGSLHRDPVLLVHIGGEEVGPALPARPVAEPHPDVFPSNLLAEDEDLLAAISGGGHITDVHYLQLLPRLGVEDAGGAHGVQGNLELPWLLGIL